MKVLATKQDGERVLTLLQSSDRPDVFYVEVSGEEVPDAHLYSYSSNMLRPFNLHNKLAYGCKLDKHTVIFKPYWFIDTVEI